MIPVFAPDICEADIAAVVAALRRGEISGNFGQALAEFEGEFAAFSGCRHGIAVTSGTTALQLAVAAVGIGEGDEVLVSASTNIASGLAMYHNRAVGVPVDSEARTWNLDLDLIEGLITERTRAIMPVHLFGHPVDMHRLMEIAGRRGLIVIEDCAEAHGATCRDKVIGSFGHLSCFSFYANKIITTGEGGMVVTNDDALAEKLRLLRNLAFTKPRFWHERPGYNFRMTGFQAALGLAQLRRVQGIIEAKRRVATTYNRLLADLPGLILPPEEPWARNVYWMYAVLLDRERGARDALAAHLQAAGIETRTFFCPLGQQPFLRQQKGFREVPCPVADRLWENGLYLPSAPSLELSEQELVASKIAEFLRR